MRYKLLTSAKPHTLYKAIGGIQTRREVGFMREIREDPQPGDR